MASIFKYKRYRRIYESGFLVCNRLVSVFNSSIGFYTSEESIREELFGVDNLSDWEAMDVEVKAKPFMLDIARCNVLMGYRTERLDKAAMLEFSVYKRITDYRNSGYEHFVECSEDIQQFHNANPDADLSDHYYWDDVLNAGTDGYLDD